MASENAVKRRR